MTVQATLDTWLAAHPYLKEAARFQQTVEAALRGNETLTLPAPQWDDYAGNFSQGMPLLGDRGLVQAVAARAGEPLARLVEGMTAADIPDEVRGACALCLDALRASPSAAAELIEQLASGKGDAGRHELEVPGTIRYLAWMVLERVLRPWVTGYEQWAEDVSWGRPYCPVCGAPPAMAQLARTKKGRERFLSCGCCRCRWSYQRTACPFCGNQDQARLGILELSREEDLRLDICRECNGFLKTYTGEGDEALLLADWSTIHLDVLAGQEGFQRHARSLYDL